MIRAEAAAQRYKVDAEGQRSANEAENILSDAARASRTRARSSSTSIEGIMRESVKPMEKIDSIKIVHVDGAAAAAAMARKNVTDEVIDSALRYRVQGPMIDSLMKEIGIEGGSLGRMSDVIRDAKDIAALTRDGKKGAKEKPVKPGEDDRDR